MARGHLLLLALLAALVGSSWLAWRQPDGQIEPLDRDGKPAPDYYLSGLTLQHYGPDGALQRTLQAARMAHVAGQGTELEQPHLTVQAATGAPWVISGASGRLDAAGETLTMPDDVLITRRASAANRPLRLETSNLRYRPAEGYAETDEAVTVTSDRDRIDAVGLRAWLLDPGRIQFRSQVRGHYEP